MNLNDIFEDLGIPVTKEKPKGGASPLPGRVNTAPGKHRTAKLVPCVIFHPDCLTLKDAEVDVANGEHGWFPTSHNSMCAEQYIGHPELKEALQACINEIIMIRAEAMKQEQKLIGKMFTLTRLSRPELFATPVVKNDLPEIPE